MLDSNKKFYLGLLLIVFIIWFILPNLNIDLISNNLEKDINATAYIYSEIEIKEGNNAP